MELAMKEYDSSALPPAPGDGASFTEIKGAWKSTTDTQRMDFNERLPTNERDLLVKAQQVEASNVQQWDRHTVADPPLNIEGVYLEPTVGF